MNCQRVAIVPGSFDPITNGHVDLVGRAAAQYDKVYLAVMINPDKNYLFSIEQRTEIAKAALKDMNNVEVIHSEGMLWELARDLDACAIVKGVRNEADVLYEKKMAEFNSAHYPHAETVLLASDPALEGISSTLVRQRLAQQESIEGLLPKAALEVIQKLLVR